VNVTPKTERKLLALAEIEERSVASVIRQAIREYLDRREVTP
jgi:predicted transcriptional regulator